MIEGGTDMVVQEDTTPGIGCVQWGNRSPCSDETGDISGKTSVVCCLCIRPLFGIEPWSSIQRAMVQVDRRLPHPRMEEVRGEGLVGHPTGERG